MLSAKNARVLANRGQLAFMKKQLKDVLEYIGSRAKQGWYTIEYGEQLETGVIEELHRLGYNVEIIQKNDRFHYYQINWCTFSRKEQI
jgi:hypothetical protein